MSPLHAPSFNIRRHRIESFNLTISQVLPWAPIPVAISVALEYPFDQIVELHVDCQRQASKGGQDVRGHGCVVWHCVILVLLPVARFARSVTSSLCWQSGTQLIVDLEQDRNHGIHALQHQLAGFAKALFADAPQQGGHVVQWV